MGLEHTIPVFQANEDSTCLRPLGYRDRWGVCLGMLNYNANEGTVLHDVGLHFIYKTKLRTILCCSNQYLRSRHWK
jgi:hypothetical protein